MGMEAPRPSSWRLPTAVPVPVMASRVALAAHGVEEPVDAGIGLIREDRVDDHGFDKDLFDGDIEFFDKVSDLLDDDGDIGKDEVASTGVGGDFTDFGGQHAGDGFEQFGRFGVVKLDGDCDRWEDGFGNVELTGHFDEGLNVCFGSRDDDDIGGVVGGEANLAFDQGAFDDFFEDFSDFFGLAFSRLTMVVVRCEEMASL